MGNGRGPANDGVGEGSCRHDGGTRRSGAASNGTGRAGAKQGREQGTGQAERQRKAEPRATAEQGGTTRREAERHGHGTSSEDGHDKERDEAVSNTEVRAADRTPTARGETVPATGLQVATGGSLLLIRSSQRSPGDRRAVEHLAVRSETGRAAVVVRAAAAKLILNGYRTANGQAFGCSTGGVAFLCCCGFLPSAELLAVRRQNTGRDVGTRLPRSTILPHLQVKLLSKTDPAAGEGGAHEVDRPPENSAYLKK